MVTDSPRPTEALLLDRAGNWAVTHLSDRAFPGLHVQGDTLSVLREQLVGAARMLRDTAADAEAMEELDYAITELDEMLAYYERVLARHGISLPYLPRSDD